MLSVNAEVIMRYFLRSPLVWVVEISEVLLLFITFLGAAWVLKKEGHVKMDIVLSRFKPRAQAMANVVTSILSAIVVSLLVWYGILVTLEHYQRGLYQPTLLEIPNAAVLFIIPLGALLLVIQLIRRAYMYILVWKEHRQITRVIIGQ
jgi:TRAP-type C4-dicarboxylate transport system permease small subunit